MPAMPSCCCEPLEERKLLAYANFVSAASTATSLSVVVDYTGIDQSTLGPGDVTFQTTGRSAVASTSIASVAQRPGGVLRVTYGIPAYEGAWGATDTGTYTVSTPPGAVTDGLGHNLAWSSLASLWLWFGQPKARLAGQQIRATDWLVTVQYDSLNGINESTLGAGDLVLTGGTPSSMTVAQIIRTNPNSIKVVYSVGAPGGAWSYASNGTYTISLASNQVADNSARQATGHFFASYYLWFATPRAELEGYSTGAAQWTVTVKFSANPNTAINPATIVGDGAVYATGPKGYFENGHMTGLLHNGDGSYSATFSIVANGGSWDWSDGGTYTIKTAAGRVLDMENRAVPGGTVGTASLSFTFPAAVMVLPTNPTRTAWDVVVNYTDDGSIDMRTVTAASLRVTGPGGIDMPIHVQSVTFVFPNVVQAVYHISQPAGFENGTYQVWVNDQSVRDADGNAIIENMLGSFWLWF